MNLLLIVLVLAIAVLVYMQRHGGGPSLQGRAATQILAEMVVSYGIAAEIASGRIKPWPAAGRESR